MLDYLLKPLNRRKLRKEYGIEEKDAIVIATDWMATGPMVSEVFNPFVITSNPQREIVGKDGIVIASLLFKERREKILIPFNERKTHEFIAGKDEHFNFISETSKNEIQERLERWGNSLLFPYQCFPLDFDFFEKRFGIKVLGSKNISTISILSNKVHFYQFCKRIGIDVIDGFVASSLEEAKEGLKMFKEVYVTKERSSGGRGSFKVRNEEEMEMRLRGYKGKLLVQKWMRKVKCSPNVLVVVPSGNISTDEVAVINVSDQIIKGTKYRGNVLPSSVSEKHFDEIVEISKRIGKELAKLGYCGIFGIDFIVSRENGEKVYPVELNLRVNHSHGLVGLVYSKLRRNLPPLALLHAIACLGLGWLDKSELSSLPLKQAEIPPIGMRLVFESGWKLTSLERVKPMANVTFVGFPPDGWLVPPTGSFSKYESYENDEFFVGRVIATGEERREVERKLKRFEAIVATGFKEVKGCA